MTEDRIYTKNQKMLVLLASCVAIFITPAMGTMVNLALVSIGSEFGVGTHDLGWITTSFFVASVIFLVPAARVCSIYGKKRIFMIGIVITLLACLASSMAPTFAILCLTRVIMGVGAAFISCSGVSMISDVFKSHDRGWALGINTACVYLGASLGPIVGGLLTDAFGWRSIFFAIVPFTIVALLCISRVDLDFKTDEGGKFDHLSAVVYAVSILFVMLGLINLPKTWAIVSMVIGVVLLISFYYLEKRRDNPILNVKLFRNTRFSRSIFAVLMNYAASYSVAFFLSLYLQNLGHLSATNASLILLIQPLIQTVLTPYAGRLSDTLDMRILPTAGMIITGVGLGILLFAGTEINYVIICVAMVVIGTGFSLFSAPNTNAVMSCVKPVHYNEASAMLSTMRQSGMMLSLGIAMCVISVVMGSADVISPDTYDDFVTVMHISWVINICFCAMGAVVSWFRGPEQD
jgi:MFS family permease